MDLATILFVYAASMFAVTRCGSCVVARETRSLAIFGVWSADACLHYEDIMRACKTSKIAKQLRTSAWIFAHKINSFEAS